MASRTPIALWWIIALKVLKALSLVALGAALLLTRDMPPASFLAEVAHALHLPLASHLVRRAMEAATSLTPRREVLVALAAFAYGSLFGVEAVGLWRRASWARWLTVIATGGLIPLEAYEIARRPTLVRILALLTNIGVVAYLVWRRDAFQGATRG